MCAKLLHKTTTQIKIIIIIIIITRTTVTAITITIIIMTTTTTITIITMEAAFGEYYYLPNKNAGHQLLMIISAKCSDILRMRIS